MNVDRLTRLASLLDGVPSAQFNIRGWVISSQYSSCGFAGCAVDWATQDPVFQAEGLHYNEKLCNPVFKEFTNWQAVCEFFDLTVDSAEYLFSGREYFLSSNEITPADVAERIRQTLRRHEVIVGRG